MKVNIYKSNLVTFTFSVFRLSVRFINIYYFTIFVFQNNNIYKSQYYQPLYLLLMGCIVVSTCLVINYLAKDPHLSVQFKPSSVTCFEFVHISVYFKPSPSYQLPVINQSNCQSILHLHLVTNCLYKDPHLSVQFKPPPICQLPVQSSPFVILYETITRSLTPCCNN